MNSGGTSVWTPIIGYCLIPIFVFYISRIVEAAYKGAIGCLETSQNCEIYNRFGGQRTIVLSILLGSINVYRIVAERLPLHEPVLQQFAMTTPFVILCFALAFGSLTYGIFRVVDMGFKPTNAQASVKILIYIVNSCGLLLLFVSIIVLIQYIVLFAEE